MTRQGPLSGGVRPRVVFDMTFPDRNLGGSGHYARSLFSALARRDDLEVLEISSQPPGLARTLWWLASGARTSVQARRADLLHCDDDLVSAAGFPDVADRPPESVLWSPGVRTRFGMPRRSDIDPLDIPKLLPHVMLVEVLPVGRYRYRLIGTENTDAQGVHATGRYLDEVLPGPEYKEHVLRLYDECAQSRRALYSECLFISPQDRTPERHIKVLFLPLSDNGVAVNQILVVQVYFYMVPSTRERHFLDVRPFKEIAHELL